jgi:hypothetical protein
VTDAPAVGQRPRGEPRDEPATRPDRSGDTTSEGAGTANEGRRWGKLVWAIGLAVLVRPRLWGTALVVSMRLARPGWWRHRPFLPVPDGAYWRFRMVTAYGGDGSADPSTADAVAYLRWCRRTRVGRG